jgi:hypothetical protein
MYNWQVNKRISTGYMKTFPSGILSGYFPIIYIYIDIDILCDPKKNKKNYLPKDYHKGLDWAIASSWAT